MKRWGAVLTTAMSALAAAAATAPAYAADVDADPGSVGVSVQITPIECASGCGAGVEGVGSLAASGLASMEPVLWAATLLLGLGTALALRTIVVRRSKPAPASDSGDGACQS
ncbi:hypothetical protein QE374_002593 [Microbacterium sp. SORGH_AS428]|uniref:hypothetical protein n=1 Tax=Microbacterium sp. SORGH_AS_0428 TaxID=3041788 RepID=UPI00285B2EB1|nr:hypothetical protein [Microbacterium sp. SORGH_AS_0428]MDR6200684.1 hypothetical protein [Microbacterium sp. SORGH_AS_0428]